MASSNSGAKKLKAEAKPAAHGKPKPAHSPAHGKAGAKKSRPK